MSLKVQHGGDPRRDGYVLRVVLQKQNGGVRGCSGLDGIKRTLEGRIYRLPDLGHGIGNTLEGIGLHTVFFRMAAGGDHLRQALPAHFIQPGGAFLFSGHGLRRSDGDGGAAIITVKGRFDINIIAKFIGPVVLDDTAGDRKVAAEVSIVRISAAPVAFVHIYAAAIVSALVACDLTAADRHIRGIDAAHISADHAAGDFRDAAVNAPTAIVPDLTAADRYSGLIKIVSLHYDAVGKNTAALIIAQ